MLEDLHPTEKYELFRKYARDIWGCVDAGHSDSPVVHEQWRDLEEYLRVEKGERSLLEQHHETIPSDLRAKAAMHIFKPTAPCFDDITGEHVVVWPETSTFLLKCALRWACERTQGKQKVVLIPEGSFRYNFSIETLVGTQLVHVPVCSDTKKLTSERLEEAIVQAHAHGDAVAALILDTPNNPWMQIYNKEELQEIAHVALKHDIPIVNDLYLYGTEHPMHESQCIAAALDGDFGTSDEQRRMANLLVTLRGTRRIAGADKRTKAGFAASHNIECITHMLRTVRAAHMRWTTGRYLELQWFLGGVLADTIRLQAHLADARAHAQERLSNIDGVNVIISAQAGPFICIGFSPEIAALFKEQGIDNGTALAEYVTVCGAEHCDGVGSVTLVPLTAMYTSVMGFRINATISESQLQHTVEVIERALCRLREGVTYARIAPHINDAYTHIAAHEQQKLLPHTYTTTETHFPKTELETLLQWVKGNTHSSFYADRLTGFGESLTSSIWEQIPLLRREDIQGVSFWDRVHVPYKNVPYIRNTYGSSGKRIMMTARTSFGNYDNPYKDLKNIMSFFQSAHHEFPRLPVSDNLQTYFGDVGNLDASVAIIKAAGIEVLYTTPYTALALADMLKQRGILEQIKVVQLCGERCSPLQFRKLKEQYAGASVYGNFASSETRETVAITCSCDRAKGGSLVLEAVDELYCEVVHPETGEPIEDEGVHGELVITTLFPVPFPLIRYATGDIAVYRKRTCACEQKKRGFEIVGRKTIFPVRLVRGELTVNAVESALQTIPAIANEYFEIHYSEEETRTTALPRVHIVLMSETNERQNPDALARQIESQLHVFPTYTYAEGIEAGIYLPLTVSFINEAPAGPVGKPKSPIVVRHVAEAIDDIIQKGNASYARD